MKSVAEIAADWWVQKVQYPSFDNGTEAQGGTPMAGLMALLISANNTIPEDDLEKFKARIINAIENEGVRRLATDYGPCHELSRLTEGLNIPSSSFPWKTLMVIDDNSVKVSEGYQAEFTELVK